MIVTMNSRRTSRCADGEGGGAGPHGWSGSGVFPYRVTRMDAITYVGAVLIPGSVSVLANVRTRATGDAGDPVSALRHE